MASFDKRLPTAAGPPRHPDSKYTTHRSLLELERSQGVAIYVVTAAFAAAAAACCCYGGNERERPPQIRTSIDKKRRSRGCWRGGCKERWGMSMKTKRSLHFCPEWHVLRIRRHGWLMLWPLINIPHAPTGCAWYTYGMSAPRDMDHTVFVRCGF